MSKKKKKHKSKHQEIIFIQDIVSIFLIALHYIQHWILETHWFLFVCFLLSSFWCFATALCDIFSPSFSPSFSPFENAVCEKKGTSKRGKNKEGKNCGLEKKLFVGTIYYFFFPFSLILPSCKRGREDVDGVI